MKEERKEQRKVFLYGVSLIVVIAVSWIFVINLCGTSKFVTSTKTVPQEQIHAQYASEYDGSLESMANISDYVFVARVIGYCDTEYKDKVSFINTNGKEQEVANIFTRYQVEVIENIKNEVPVGSKIKINKLGGVCEDLSGIEMLENDKLPVEGKTYVFMATKNGNEYVVGGENTTIEITQDKMIGKLRIKNLDKYLSD